ncbi:MAG: peptidoglycan-binding domain-containing protein [Bacteroidetes bacterium]|nr:peptidoglycan-binding domain-containing protein [Bacteroidota bacterium]
MKKNKKLIFWIAGLLILAYVIWHFVKKRATSAHEAALPGTNHVPISPASLTGFPLKQGSRGKYVTALQQYLKDAKKESLTVDGILGPKTAAALSKYGFSLPMENAAFNKVFGK